MIPAVEPGGESTSKKDRRRGEVKARLRRSLHGLAADRSLLEVRVSDITSEAGLSRSAFYFYYEDKRDLLIETIREMTETLFDRANVRLADDDDPRKLIREVLETNAATWSRNAHILRMVIEASIYDELIRSFWRGIVEDFMAAVAERIAIDQRAGIVPAEIEPAMCAEFLVVATEGYFYRRLVRVDGSPEDAVAVLEPIWTRILYA
jgi:AcrR family transcriptional regulator